jgi:signal transduction histidine kinase
VAGGAAPGAPPPPTLAVPVSRFGLAHAAVVVRLPNAQERDLAERLAAVTARRVGPVLERLRLLEEGEQRERSLVAAVEKRLVRVGYDLHDGPVQDAVVLAEELRLLMADLEPLVGEKPRAAVGQALASVREQVCWLADELRELAQSLETTAVSRRPLAELIEREAAALRRRAGVACAVDVRADLDGLTDSQRIALYRVVQEALANVAEHSDASTVRIRVTESSSSVSLTVADDGCGFDTESGLEAAAERGRLGLIGMSERVRLLGGVFRVTSAPGRGTTIRAVLARWLPPA